MERSGAASPRAYECAPQGAATPAPAPTPACMVVHFSNATAAGGAREYGTLNVQLALPRAFIAAQSQHEELRVTLFSPYEASPRTVDCNERLTG